MTTPALELRGVSLHKRGSAVLDGVNLTLQPGDFCGLIGPNGGGKSMLLAVILGLETPDGGQVSVFGRSPRQARGLVGWVPQFARFDPTFPIRVEDAVGSGLLASRVPRAQVAERVDTALGRVGMAGKRGSQVGRLSGGEVQRVLIARALVGDPKLLLLDEPSASLDAPQAATLHDLLAELAGDHAILLVSHDVGVISRHVHSIACLNRKLVHHGAKELTRQQVEEVYGCSVDFVVHAHTHVVLEDHPGTHEHGGCGHHAPPAGESAP